MLERTNIPEAPWWVIEGDDKWKARLNCMNHLLQQFDYKDVPKKHIKIPERKYNSGYKQKQIP